VRRSIAAALLSLSLAIPFVTTAQTVVQDPEPDAATPLRQTVNPPNSIQAALTALETLLAKTRQAGDRRAEANLLDAIATSYNALGQRQKAVEQYQAARVLWHGSGDNQHEATTVAHIGDVYRNWGFPEQANRYYRDALTIYPPADKSGRGATLNNLSLTYFSLNNRKKCLESLNEALGIFRDLRDRRGEALALVNLGAAYTFLAHDPLKAIGFLQQGITRLELLDDRDSEAGALDKMGVAWHLIGKSEMAGLSFQHALMLFHAAGDASGEAAVRKHMLALSENQPQASIR